MNTLSFSFLGIFGFQFVLFSCFLNQCLIDDHRQRLVNFNLNVLHNLGNELHHSHIWAKSEGQRAESKERRAKSKELKAMIKKPASSNK